MCAIPFIEFNFGLVLQSAFKMYTHCRFWQTCGPFSSPTRKLNRIKIKRARINNEPMNWLLCVSKRKNQKKKKIPKIKTFIRNLHLNLATKTVVKLEEYLNEIKYLFQKQRENIASTIERILLILLSVLFLEWDICRDTSTS